MRAAIALSSVKTVDNSTLLRALAVYEVEGMHFAEAYLVAQAETPGIGSVLSFDKSIDRVGTVQRQEP
jgi:predicted nucleic acid-binding protein